MSRSFLILLLISVNAMNEFGAAVAEDECDANSDCKSSSRVCCRGYLSYERRSCRLVSCAGRYCSTDGDCGGEGECCKSNKCVTNGCTECNSNFNCSAGEYCCELRYISDHNVCRQNCIDQTCHSKSDCGGPNEECNWNNKCAKSIQTSPSVAEDECDANSDCENSYFNLRVCCRGYYGITRRRCRFNSCAGESCSTDGDCGGAGECCKFNKCVTNGCGECHSNFDCSSSEYCCKQRYTSDHNVCRRNCIGQTCYSSRDCGGPHEKCNWNNECVRSTQTVQTAPSVAEDECDANSDCESSYFSICCPGYASDSRRQCGYYSCSGLYCSTDGDCGGKGECCQFNKCVTNGCAECYSNFDCSSSEYCCQLRYLSDHNVCRRNCIGQTCQSDSDCGGPNEECDSADKKCVKSTSSSGAWIVPVVVVSVMLFVVFCGGGYSYRWFRNRPARHRVVVGRPAPQRTAAIIALRETKVRTTAPPPPAYYNQGQNYPPPMPQPYPPPQPLQFASP